MYLHPHSPYFLCQVSQQKMNRTSVSWRSVDQEVALLLVKYVVCYFPLEWLWQINQEEESVGALHSLDAATDDAHALIQLAFPSPP